MVLKAAPKIVADPVVFCEVQIPTQTSATPFRPGNSSSCTNLRIEQKCELSSTSFSFIHKSGNGPGTHLQFQAPASQIEPPKRHLHFYWSTICVEQGAPVNLWGFSVWLNIRGMHATEKRYILPGYPARWLIGIPFWQNKADSFTLEPLRRWRLEQTSVSNELFVNGKLVIINTHCEGSDNCRCDIGRPISRTESYILSKRESKGTPTDRVVERL